MTTWGGGQQYPDPNQAYYAGQPGYPPPGYGGAPPPGYPGAYPPGAPPAPGGYPAAPPPTGYPGGPPPAGGYPGFQVPPSQPPYGDPYSNQGVYSGTDRDEEDLTAKGFDFTDKSIRRGFIRKVYSILMVQLSITLAFICWFVYHRPTKIFIHSHPELLFISLILLLVTLITLACCGDVRRKAPMNFIFLFIFTLAESFFLATTSSRYDSDIVLMAVGITAAVCLGLTLFAFQTKWDFTMMGGILFVALIILFLFGIFTLIFHTKVMKLVYASLGALLFSIYLIYDTQLMIGGNHKVAISPEEYIFAALNLYLDITQIFLYILSILGSSRN